MSETADELDAIFHAEDRIDAFVACKSPYNKDKAIAAIRVVQDPSARASLEKELLRAVTAATSYVGD